MCFGGRRRERGGLQCQFGLAAFMLTDGTNAYSRMCVVVVNIYLYFVNVEVGRM